MIIEVFEYVIEEFIGEGREVIDSRGRLRRRRGQSAERDSVETQGAHLMRF